MPWFVSTIDPMHSHSAKPDLTVAINALWCLLIALALLAFPIIARQARLQNGIAQSPASAAPATTIAPPAGHDAILITQTDAPATRH